MAAEPRQAEGHGVLPDGPLSRLRAPVRPSRLRLSVTITVSGLAFLLGCAAFLGRWTQTHGEAGVRWADTPDGVALVSVVPGGAADRAGLQAGDLLVALGDDPAVSALQAADRLWRAEPNVPLPVLVQRDGLQRVLVLVPDPGAEDRHLYAYLSLVGLLALVLGTVLTLKVPLGAVRLPYYLLSLAAFGTLVFSHAGRGDLLDWIVYWTDGLSRAALVPAFLHFAVAFTRPDLSRRARRSVWLLYAPVPLILGVDAWLLGAEGIYRFRDPVGVLDRLHRFQMAAVALGLAVGILVFSVAYLRATRDRVRWPLKWLFWGGALGFGPFVVLYLFPSALGLRLPGWSDLSALTLLLVPLCFASAVARYRLTDLELFFKRGLAGAALAGCTVAIYLAAAIVFGRMFPAGPKGLPEVLALLVAAGLLPRLRTFIHWTVDRIFYQDRYDHRRTLQEFGRELNRERELKPLVEKLVRRVSRTLGVDRVVVLVADDEGACRASTGADDALSLPLDSPLAVGLERGGFLDLEDLREPRADAPPAGLFEEAGLRHLVPLTVQGRLVGVLALGTRRDRSPLNSEDRELLEAVARHAAVAVEGARLFEAMQRRAGEIERLKDFNEAILESSQVGVLVVDENERVTGWNRSLSRLTGRGRQEALGRTLAEVLDSELLPVLRTGFAAAGERGTRRYRQYLPGGAGEPSRLVNLGFSRLRAADGETSWVVTFDDVTEGVRREQILAQQERLASVGLLASGVAHEVNTPLTGISSYAQMLLDETDPSDPRYPLLQQIEKQTFRASDIARRLLNLSRPDHQGFVEVDINELVEETLSLFEPQLRGRRVFVRRELSEDVEPVRGHRGKLQQVLLNLLLNARDAMPAGGEVRIRTEAEKDGVLVEVRDSGEGIRPELLGRIYDPFFTTKEPGSGTGLGLSITYGIVQEHSGTIGVESEVGEGTRFQVRLPRLPKLRAAAG